MILGMQIGMFIFGIVTLASGKLTLSKTRVVAGPLARHLALLLLAPVPLAYTAHGFVHADFVTRGKKVGNDSTFRWTVIGVEAGITVLCLGSVYAVGFSAAINPWKAKEAEADHGSLCDIASAVPPLSAAGPGAAANQIRRASPSARAAALPAVPSTNVRAEGSSGAASTAVRAAEP